MAPTDPQTNLFAMRMWKSLLATQELLTIYIGVKLGFYEALAAAPGPLTFPEFAHRCDVAPRYAREWLEHQAVCGIVTVSDPRAPADQREYQLGAAHARVLTVSDDPLSMASLAVLPLGGIAAALPELLAGYRTGDGVPDASFGDDWRQGHAGANRALFAHQLAGWIQDQLPEVHQAAGRPGARIADVACGAGWSSIALARAYPGATVVGLDWDGATLADARQHAAAAGVADRVQFVQQEAAHAPEQGSYDLVCLFDALHEMAQPVEVLRACRRLRHPQGAVLVMDAKVAATFTAPGDDIERFQYGTSVLHCLPASMAGGVGGTGTVLRPGMLRDLARSAGFAAVSLVGIDDRFHRMYHLVG